jgi:ATP-dependent helicase HrpB
LEPLPIDANVHRIADALKQSRALVLVAEAGAGKTTRVPPALLDAGPLLLLQPRRAATRAVARRIATERGWAIEREIGWQIRFERRFSDDTRLLVATEGVLTARLLHDPLLSSFNTVVLDEFHERSIHTDLGLALAREAWRARQDLRLLEMSATMDAKPVSAFLGDCPIVSVPGRAHPIDLAYVPDAPVTDVAADLYVRSTGDILCFVQGEGDPPCNRGLRHPHFRRRRAAALRSARRRRTGSGTFGIAVEPSPHHRLHQHRRDIGHRSACDGRGRRWASEGGALRCRAWHR